MEKLLGHDSSSTKQAHSGSAYSFSSRPFQYKRPRLIQLQKAQRQAAVDEIERLMTECNAIEVAPEHDRDKALTPSAAAWERRPLLWQLVSGATKTLLVIGSSRNQIFVCIQSVIYVQA